MEKIKNPDENKALNLLKHQEVTEEDVVSDSQNEVVVHVNENISETFSPTKIATKIPNPNVAHRKLPQHSGPTDVAQAILRNLNCNDVKGGCKGDPSFEKKISQLLRVLHESSTPKTYRKTADMLEELNKKHSLGITIPDISEHVFYTPQLVPSITKKYPPRISESIEEDGGPKNAKDTSEPSEIDKMVSILIKAGNESYNPSEQVAILVILERIKENLNPSLEIPDFSAYIPPKRRSVGYSRPVPLNLEIWERIVDGAIKKARNNKKGVRTHKSNK